MQLSDQKGHVKLDNQQMTDAGNFSQQKLVQTKFASSDIVKDNHSTSQVTERY